MAEVRGIHPKKMKRNQSQAIKPTCKQRMEWEIRVLNLWANVPLLKLQVGGEHLNVLHVIAENIGFGNVRPTGK